MARGPGRDDARRVGSLSPIGQQVVGVIKGDVALRVPSGHKEPFGVLDADDLDPRGVEDQERLSHCRHSLEEVVGSSVAYELLANREGAPRE